ncbi:MAG: hypothetical protein JW864_03040 [Spirochaetes bacterium]|nr:hypothetical protein [Spirochaetota bacterium]
MNPDRKTRFNIIFILFMILTVPALLSAKTVAFIGVQNLSLNSEYDYLAAFTEGVILFDLSGLKDITLVERTRLEKILNEQQLHLAGLTEKEQEKKSIEVGRLLAADSLVSVDYTLVGGEVAFTSRVVDTSKGSVQVVTSRGTLENDIHILSEGLARILTGKNYSFVNEAEKRSLLTMRDIVPGTISLYCNLQHAEIKLNDKFAGYTTGNLYTPLTIPDIDPGTYNMKISLSKDFGVIKLPEFIFSDWQEKVTVKPGRITIQKAVIRHFNDMIYNYAELFDEDYELTEKDPELKSSKSISFTDRTGKEIQMDLNISANRTAAGPNIICMLVYEGKNNKLEITEKDSRKDMAVGKVKLKFDLRSHRDNSDRFNIRIIRTDIYQGMHRQ